MRTITTDELNAVLDAHVLWLSDHTTDTRADLIRANLRGANLTGADLRGANMRYANLTEADLTYADLRGANLTGADLRGAHLIYADLCVADMYNANLTYANLARANLIRANLTYADLRVADMYNANLTYANLARANLTGAIMPDGRKWEEYKQDPLAGICDNPEARKRAIAAWGNHDWGECPMSKANGYAGFYDVPQDKRIAVAAFVALFDAGLLHRPEEAE